MCLCHSIRVEKHGFFIWVEYKDSFSKLYMSVNNSCVSRGLYKTNREIWVAREEPLRSAMGRRVCGKFGVCE